jgi:hypothetical protein
MQPPNIYLAFSKPPSDVSKDEFNRWYDFHARENIRSPGFVSAQRYELKATRDAPVAFSHLALYEYTGDWSVWRADLDRRLETGDIALPDWFSRVDYGSWACVPLTDRITPDRS